MDTVNEALQLVKRQEEIEAAMRQPGGIRITEERELIEIRSRLREVPQAAHAVLAARENLRLPASMLTEADVARWVG